LAHWRTFGAQLIPQVQPAVFAPCNLLIFHNFLRAIFGVRDQIRAFQKSLDRRQPSAAYVSFGPESSQGPNAAHAKSPAAIDNNQGALLFFL
jgi:hypothetical protein